MVITKLVQNEIWGRVLGKSPKKKLFFNPKCGISLSPLPVTFRQGAWYALYLNLT